MTNERENSPAGALLDHSDAKLMAQVREPGEDVHAGTPHDLLDHAEAATPSHAGDKLAKRRLHLGLTEADVAARLKMSPKRVAALESGEWETFGSRVTLRGFVRAYAKVVGLDADELARALPDSTSETNMLSLEPTLSQPIGGKPARLGLRRWVSPTVLAIVVAGVAFTLIWVDRDMIAQRWAKVLQGPVAAPVAMSEPKTVSEVSIQAMTLAPSGTGDSAAASPEPTIPNSEAVPMARVQKAPSGMSALIGASNITADKSSIAQSPVNEANATNLRLVFEQECWVEITAPNGTAIMSGIVPGGAERVVDAGAGAVVVIGNAPAVKLFRAGKLVDLTPFTSKSVARITLN
jgi:cytoskeleton protein RodZ